MTKEECKVFFNKYFDIDEHEFELKYNEKSKDDYDEFMFTRILRILKQHLDVFIDDTASESKQRAGRLLLKHNMHSFVENNRLDILDRLRDLFKATTNKNINTYNILYSTVLTNANLNQYYDKDTNSYVKLYKPEHHNFNKIYNCVKNVLELDDEETVKMFEKCTSLMSKTTTQKIEDITSFIKRLIVWNKNADVYKRLFTSEEALTILKNNPSLYSSSTSKIKESYMFILKKVHNILLRQKIDDKDFLDEKQKFAKKLLNGNSSLLLIDTNKIKACEWFVRNDLKEVVSENYYRVLSEMYNEPKYFSILNDLKYYDLYKNAESNIKFLESMVGQEHTANYIKENPYFLAMNKNDFEFLLKSIAKIDMQNGGREFMQKFLFMGKSLFGNDYRFKPDVIIKRLKEGKCRKKIEIDLKDDAQCFKKFVKLFVGGQDKQEQLLEKANQLVEFSAFYKNTRQKFDECKNNTVNQIKYLSKVMQNGSTKFKKDYILSVADNVTHLMDLMLSLYNANNFEEIKINENERKSQAKSLISEITEIYNSKHVKMSKLYSGIDDLHCRTNIYLSDNLYNIAFSQSLYKEFNSEIKDVYVKHITEIFNTEPTAQQSMLDDSIDVKVDENLLPAFCALQKSFDKTSENGDVCLNFQK